MDQTSHASHPLESVLFIPVQCPGALAVVEGRRVVVWPDVLGCPAAAAREHLSTQPDTVPAAGLENPAALPGLCFARGGMGGWQSSLGRGARV